MAHVLPQPMPCELCPYTKTCKVAEAERENCKLKNEENQDFIDWRLNHPYFGMTFAELNDMQH